MNDRLENLAVSEIKFGKGGRIDYTIGMGCGLFVNEGTMWDTGPTEQLEWKNWESFYFQARGFWELEFSNSDFWRTLLVNVKDVGLEFDHLGIYINDDESDTEEEFFNGQVKYFID